MRKLQSLSALRAFEEAARLGSFHAAATELSLTPSAISHQVRTLEAWFERPLFVRSTRHVEPTADGLRLRDELTPAFDQIHDACAALKAPGQRRSLALHCAPSFATKWLGPRLARFMAEHPGLTLRLSSDAQAPDLGRQAALDLAITYGRPKDRASGTARQPIEVLALGEEATLPMASPRLIGSSAVKAPRDVLRLPLIESKLNPVHWADWCRLNKVRLPEAARPSFDRGALAVAAAVDGVGVCLETTRFAEAELARGELVVLDGPGFARIARETHFLVWRRRDADQPAMQTFRDWLLLQLA